MCVSGRASYNSKTGGTLQIILSLPKISIHRRLEHISPGESTSEKSTCLCIDYYTPNK